MLEMKFLSRIFLMIIIVAGFFSCRTVREITPKKIKPLNKEKLLRRAGQNTTDYDDLSINRMLCHFSANETNANFRINLKAQRDKNILLSVSKINIPMGQILLTPDSVKYVNYLDRNYLVDDYNILRRLLDIDIDFYTIQSIISNNMFLCLAKAGNNFQNFITTVEDGMYVLKSENWEDNNPGKPVRRKFSQKIAYDPHETVYQKMFFNPVTFALEKLYITDTASGRELEMYFDDFVEVGKNYLPGSVDLRMLSDFKEVELKLRMSGFSTGNIENVDLQIPERYEQIYIN